jgi:hypothetical protein
LLFSNSFFKIKCNSASLSYKSPLSLLFCAYIDREKTIKKMAALLHVSTIAALVFLLLTSGLSTAQFTPQLRQMVTFGTNKLASDYEFYGCWSVMFYPTFL